MLRRKRFNALYPEELRRKQFVQWVGYMVALSIKGEPPHLLKDVLRRKLATRWQRRYIELRLEQWRQRIGAAQLEVEAQR